LSPSLQSLNGWWSTFWMQTDWARWPSLMLLFLVPLVWYLTVLANGRMVNRLDRVQPGVSAGNRVELSPLTCRLKNWLFVGAFIALVIAFAGPRLGWRWIESRQAGVDMIIAVDVSKSMLAEDLSPNRLERARRIILDLLEESSGDRVGLVFFAGAAFLQCPLTSDHDAVRSFLEQLDVDLVPVGGTNLAEAARESLRALGAGAENNPQNSGGVVIILSDGEDQQGAIKEAVNELNKAKATVLTVGFGTTEGAPVPDRKGGFLKDAQGNLVVSRLNDDGLKTIAKDTDGRFFRADETGFSASAVYREFLQKSGPEREYKQQKYKNWFERFQWPAALALVLLLLELFIKDFKSAAYLLIFLGALFVGANPSLANTDRAKYNEVVSSLAHGSDPAAEERLKDLTKSSDQEVARRSHYNLANMLAVKGSFEEAVGHYEKALSMDFQDQQVRDNLAWAKRQANSKGSSKQDQQKQDQQKQDQQKQDQQKQDQQKQDQQKQDQQKQDQQKQDQQKQDQQKEDQLKEDQQKQDQQKQDQQKQDQQKRDIDQAEAEKLLRSVPDERKSVRPLYRSGKGRPESVERDW
jgi:Ca-activated chloride channel homolog